MMPFLHHYHSEARRERIKDCRGEIVAHSRIDKRKGEESVSIAARTGGQNIERDRQEEIAMRKENNKKKKKLEK